MAMDHHANERMSHIGDDSGSRLPLLYQGDHETILYVVLKRLHIGRNHADYEDYLQEARLLFPEIYAAFPEDPEAKPHHFLAYAQQKLYWAC